MALIEINWNPTRREQRRFAGIMLVGCTVVGAILRGYAHPGAAVAVWGIGAVIGGVGLLFPSAVRPVYLLLTVVTWPIGWVMSYVFLGLFYYIVITGTGVVFRLLGRDPLRRRFDPRAETYWQPKVLPGPEDKSRYFRQF